ncbi:hypothetical protein EJB05_14585, partial [Eragrostis curvula]
MGIALSTCSQARGEIVRDRQPSARSERKSTLCPTMDACYASLPRSGFTSTGHSKTDKDGAHLCWNENTIGRAREKRGAERAIEYSGTRKGQHEWRKQLTMEP